MSIMRNEYIRYFIGFMIAIGLIIVVIFLLFSGGGGKSPSSSDVVKPLYAYADTDAVVRMTINGPTTAPQNRVEVQVTVGADQAVYQQFQGYDGDVVNTQSFANTRNSYYVFLRSIAGAGFHNGNNDPSLVDSAGYCPLGRIYTFELIQNGKALQNYWATSCGGTKTYLGNLSLTTTLFENQIPSYNTLTGDLNF